MKRKVWLVVSLLLIVAMLAACSAPAAPSEAPAQSSAAQEQSAAPAQSEGSGAEQTSEAPAKDETTQPQEAAQEAPAGGGSDIVMGLANGYMGNTWRAQYVEEFEKKCQELKDKGVIKDFVVASTNTDVTEQMNQINNMISSGVNCIQLNPISPASVAPIQAACDAAGVMLVINTDPAAIDENLVEVLVDNKQYFEIMTKWFVEAIGGKGDIVHITGTPGMPADLVRQKVVEDILAGYPDIKVLATAPGSWSQTESQAAMSTFLSTYDKIDGMLTQDIMAEGILRAYETAGKKPPTMLGDYTMSFIRKWVDMPDLNAMTTTFQPHGSAEGVQYAVRIMNGKKLKDGILGPNPLDETMMNAINLPPAYGVTYKDEPADASWKQGYDMTEFISVDTAIKVAEDVPDTGALGKTFDDADWDNMFE